MEQHGNENGNGLAKPNGKSADRQQLVGNGDKQPMYNGNGHEPPAQEEGQNGKEKDEPPKVPILQLFRFADKWDVVILIVGLFCSIMTGVAYPLSLVLFSESMEKFVNFGIYENLIDRIPDFLDYVNMTRDDARQDIDRFVTHCEELSEYYNHSEQNSCSVLDSYDSVYDETERIAIFYVVFGAVVAFCSYGQIYTFILTSERQILRMRLAFFKNIMRQEMGWFDSTSVGEMTVKFTDDIGKIHDGIGDKTSLAVQFLTSSVTGIIISFYYGWELTLVMQVCSPFLLLAFSAMGAALSNMTALERQAYAEAGGVAEEVFSSIRTVQAFSGQEKESQRYGSKLRRAYDYGVKKALAMGLGQGSGWGVIYCSWGLGFWYGGKLVRDDDYDVTEMMSVFMCALVGCQSLGLAMPGLMNLNVARTAAYGVYKFIDKVSTIDSFSEEGIQPATMTGAIKFKGVRFSYPTRPDVKILKGLDLNVSAGKTVALVGPSGCGKSTIIQLLFRFYDAAAGQVCLDGVDIRDINIRWLRQHIGLVGQEPVLFATTIAENIRYGKDGVTMEDIVQASKDANAYDFISKMPDGFDTQVGERGAQLSGGQKQRIAIARALVRKPKILLLDEATSALDTESEGIVQDALDKASKGRTTMIIAHRLSTIRDADVIVVIDKGQVVEQGSHDQLMSLGGIYSNLVSSQLRSGTDGISNQLPNAVDSSKKTENGASVPEKKKSDAHGRRKSSLSEHVMDDKDYGKMQTLWRIIILNRPEWLFVVLGCVGALFNGALQPGATLLLAQTVDAFASEDESHEKHEINRIAIACVIAGIISIFAYTMQEYMFGLSGEELTVKVRGMMFRAMVRQNIGWFDEPEHETGVLTSQLSTEASAVQGALKTSIGYSFLSFGNVVTGMVVAFIFGWRLALVLLAFIPVQIVSGLMTMKVYSGAASEGKAVMEEVSRDGMESVGLIRTVAALTKEMTIYEQFEKKLWLPYESTMKSTFKSCIIHGVSTAMHYFSFATTFWYAGRLLHDDKIDFDNVFRVIGPMIMSAQQLGRFVAHAPDFGKALKAAGNVFALHDGQPPIDAYSPKGDKPDEDTFNGKVTFSDVYFRYPMRPNVKILNGLDLSIDPGQTLALVGESGCGKSTTVQLVERFYDTEKGRVFLDSYAIKELNIQWLRSQIGLVSQEPILFDQSIAENIAYGDNSRTVSMDEIIQAAKSANIHNFIHSLPLGYETNVGSKGTQLSGGQKQRVAIARALIRKPKILLLDEATSALDAESEMIVQEALDKARAGRTCITIAHRLATIKDADKIAVFKDGVVHEIGTHDTLMAMHGLYYNLQMAQRR